MKRFLSRASCLAFLAFGGLLAQNARAIILLETGDPARNISTPGDGGGWQYEGLFGYFLGTPVAPGYFLTAAHIGNQGNFVFHGETYTVSNPVYDPGSDLVLWQVDHPFKDYAPLFTAASGDETGQAFRVFGRGTLRGGEIDKDGTPRGWGWGGYDHLQRWGSNRVADLPKDTSVAQTQYIHATFDSPGVPAEAHLSEGDSGGGLFVQENGLWKLAAVNYGVDDLYTGADGSGHFVAAIYDARGYYAQNADQTYSVVPDQGVPVPTGFYSTRVAARLAWIQSVTGVNPTALPAESFDAWRTLYFTPDQRADGSMSGPSADPDGDGVGNLLEFAFNLDPTFAEPAILAAGTSVRGLPLVRRETVAATGDTRLTVEYVRRTAGSGSGLTYQTQFTADLAARDWQTGGAETVTAINARWERVKVTDSLPLAGRRFARVAVMLAAP